MLRYDIARSNWISRQYTLDQRFSNPILLIACNAFTDFHSPLAYFQHRHERYESGFQNYILFSEVSDSFEFMRCYFPEKYTELCESLALCIDLCSRYGALEDAAALLRYQEEHNLRSEQSSLRL